MPYELGLDFGCQRVVVVKNLKIKKALILWLTSVIHISKPYQIFQSGY